MGREGATAARLLSRQTVAIETAWRRLGRPAANTAHPIARPRIESTRLVAGLLLTALIVALQAVAQAVDFGVFDLRLWALNADKHYSVFGIASLLAQAAVAAASAWRWSRVERHRWVWLALGALVGGLVIVRGLATFNAAALAVPLACVFLLVCWLTWRDPASPRATIWAGLILLATSLLLHKVGLAADTSTASDYTWAYQFTSILKHGAELAGWMLLATPIVASVDSGNGTAA